jgi:hypothetical protein
MSEDRKPTPPEAGNGAAPIVCTTVRLPDDANRATEGESDGRRAEDAGMTPEFRPQSPPRGR